MQEENRGQREGDREIEPGSMIIISYEQTKVGAKKGMGREKKERKKS